jgi:putative AbiEi antitoxin of type IV toxin-antitoxin system
MERRSPASQARAVHPLLRARADRQLGLFTTADALRAGHLPEEIRSLCRTGRWVRLRRGVLVSAEELAGHERRGRRHEVECLAALLALGRPNAVVSHVSAARLWGFPVRRALAGPVVRLTDPGAWRAGRGYVVSTAPLRSGDVVSSGPLRVTSAARTLVDCAREWPLEDAVVAMDAALLLRRTDVAGLTGAAVRAERWRGATAARRAAALADGRAESPLETRGRLRMLGSGFPHPALQVEVHSAAGLVAVVDAWFDDAAVAVEFDGQVKYLDPWRKRSPAEVAWDEKRREDALRALDVRVVRVADADLGPRWRNVEERLGHLLATPGPAARRFTTVRRQLGVPRTP